MTSELIRKYHMHNRQSVLTSFGRYRLSLQRRVDTDQLVSMRFQHSWYRLSCSNLSPNLTDWHWCRTDRYRPPDTLDLWSVSVSVGSRLTHMLCHTIVSALQDFLFKLPLTTHVDADEGLFGAS